MEDGGLVGRGGGRDGGRDRVSSFPHEHPPHSEAVMLGGFINEWSKGSDKAA